MKLKVIAADRLPADCTRYVELWRDDGGVDESVWDCGFRMWWAEGGGECDALFEDILDADGYPSGRKRPKPGLIVFGLDLYEHSGRVWSLHGDDTPDQFDTSQNAAWLFIDETRWNEYYGMTAKWEFADGKPTEKLLKAAREFARDRVRDMNLAETGSVYGYTEKRRIRCHRKETQTAWDGTEDPVVVEYDSDEWTDCESCSGYLTDEPARDADFPIGCPVVAREGYLVDCTFEQSCWAYEDLATHRYVRLEGDGYRLFGEPRFAGLFGDPCWLNERREDFEKRFGLSLAVADVTEKVWKEYPECTAAK